MKYKFNGFEFSTESLVLSHQGEDVTIRHNEAKLLALLLEQADSVVSKEDILANVWHGKVVTEQAIFQNISHLRNLFGSDAIKTFSKRGYQWQLDIEIVADEPVTASSELSSVVSDNIESNVSHAITNKDKKRFRVWPIAVSLVVVGIALVFGSLRPPAQSQGFTIATLPFVGSQVSPRSNESLTFSPLQSVSTVQYLQSPEWEFSKLSNKHPVVLAGEVREQGDVTYLDFLLKGLHGQWQGIVAARDSEQAHRLLVNHLNQSAVQDWVTQPLLPDARLAMLTLSHQANPNDFIILKQLAQAYLDANRLDSALVMAEKLEKSAKERAPFPAQDYHIAKAQLLQAQILSRKQLYGLSEVFLNSAIEGFEQIGDLKHLSDAWYANSWLRHMDNDYAGAKRSLLTSSELAMRAGDRQRELEGLTYLSIMAHKNKHSEDKYHYLLAAESKMREYDLPQYHFAKIPFHYAIFAEKEADKVPHLKQVLEFTQLNPNYWVAQSSRKSLMQYYIKQGRLDDAEQLVTRLTANNAQNEYLKTLLAHAKGQEQAFINAAQTTFEKAQLSGSTSLSLDVALMLLQEASERVNQEFYVQYIEQNASPGWLQRHENAKTAWTK